MKAIQLMMEESTLSEVDRAAKKAKTDRSKFIRAAVEKVLQEMRIREMEERCIRAYKENPITEDEIGPWLKIQAWPED